MAVALYGSCSLHVNGQLLVVEVEEKEEENIGGDILEIKSFLCRNGRHMNGRYETRVMQIANHDSPLAACEKTILDANHSPAWCVMRHNDWDE